MKERQEWMKQFMKEFEEKMNTKFDRKDKEDHHPVQNDNNHHAVTMGEDDTATSLYQGKKGRTLKVLVNSSDGDKVRVNVPLKIGKMMLKKGSKFSGKWSNALDEKDTDMIMEMIDQGHMGEIVNVESAEGDTVIIKIE